MGSTSRWRTSTAQARATTAANAAAEMKYRMNSEFGDVDSSRLIWVQPVSRRSYLEVPASNHRHATVPHVHSQCSVQPVSCDGDVSLEAGRNRSAPDTEVDRGHSKLSGSDRDPRLMTSLHWTVVGTSHTPPHRHCLDTALQPQHKHTGLQSTHAQRL